MDSLLDSLALEATAEPVEVTGRDGQSITVLVKRLRSVGEYMTVHRMVEGRRNAFTIGKGKLTVKLTPEQADLAERYGIECKRPKGDSGEILVTAPEEYEMATVIEQGVVEPPISWAEAVLLCKTNAMAALAIVNAWQKVNQLELLETEKKS